MENSKWGAGIGGRWDLDGDRQPKGGDVEGGWAGRGGRGDGGGHLGDGEQ